MLTYWATKKELALAYRALEFTFSKSAMNSSLLSSRFFPVDSDACEVPLRCCPVYRSRKVVLNDK